MEYNDLIPEFIVNSIEVTKKFYIDILDFKLEYERKEDKFIFLSYEKSQLMFEEYNNERWLVGEMEHPYGRGINFSIYSSNIDKLYKTVKENNLTLYKELTSYSYNVNGKKIYNKEFMIQDPDGYLLRFTD